MTNSLSIKLKAGFLLTVFGLNTLVGFACAVGMDMGFNPSHHQAKKVSKIHVHADGKKHEHEKKVHRHEKTAHSHATEQNDEKNNCCNDSVVKLSQSEKSVPQANVTLSPTFFKAFIVVYYNVNVSCSSQVVGSIRYFVRSYHPPIPDIRIAIQSFQI